MKNKKRLIVLVLVLALLVGATVGGTIAWLVTETAPIVNTFTVGDINITLEETTPALTEGEREAKMVPGLEIDKDPKVTVLGGSEDCWLFVKVEESTNLDSFITYGVDTGESAWTEVDATNGIYGRKVAASDDDQSFYILKDNKVTVLTTVTKGMMEEINNGTQDAPTLTFTAYSIQSANLKNGDAAVTSAADAWEVYTA
ncbi:MAG: hypothetical protein IKC02_03040, partial [Oscillospiraceae bacterium]|nr:hypothetical protein [Oscillospiraceae bacterium]